MSPDVRKGIAKAEEKKAEAEVEKKKSDALIKAREEKKKKKEEKKSSKSKPKEGDDDHITGVAKPQDHARRGKVFQFGKTSSTPIGSRTNADYGAYYLPHPTLTSPLMTISSSIGTNGLRLKVGVAQKATWHNEHVYDFNQGKVVATATLHDAGPNVHEPCNQSTNIHSFPCMPCIQQHDHHRDKITTSDGGININKMFNTAVARPVARKEMNGKRGSRKGHEKRMVR